MIQGAFHNRFSITNGNTKSINLSFRGISVAADSPMYQLVTLKWVRNLVYISLALETEKKEGTSAVS